MKHSWSAKWRLDTLLSVLPTMPNLGLLSLHNTNMNEAQQRVIFGLSTLRTLVVHFCRFYPSTKPLPTSHVTALKCTHSDLQTARRLLTILAPTVETLEVNCFDETIADALRGGLIALPKLSTFTIGARKHVYRVKSANRPEILNTLNPYTSITTIVIRSCCYPPVISIHHGDLPALRNLTCDHSLAISLMPGRLVTTYVEVCCSRVVDFWEFLVALSKTHARITSLKLFVPVNIHSPLPYLVHSSFQYLEQLTFRTFYTLVLCLVEHPGDYLLRRRIPNSFGVEGVVVLPKLKRVSIWVGYSQSTDIPLDISFEGLLKEYFIPACPALEMFECLCVDSSCALEFDRPPEPKRGWKARRLSDGSWEGLGPPPIPAEKSHAGP
jgi:hypothetical protein